MSISGEVELVDDRPDVSVIIPFFNSSETLFRAIDRVFAQSCSKWEIIVVDDGSTSPMVRPDDARLNDGRIRWLRHQSNQGVSAARNTGVAAARGLFIAFLDSDDEWMPRKLERQLMAARKSPHPKNVLCLTKILVRNPGGRVRVRPERPKENDERFDEYLFVSGGFAQTSAIFLSKELADKIKFRPLLRQYEDHLYLIDADAAGAEYVFVDEQLTIYNDDKADGRLSKEASMAHGYEFLEEAGDGLSMNARLAFEARYMARHALRVRPVATLLLMINALFRGALKPRYVLTGVVRGILPASVYAWIKSMITMRRAPS